MKKALAATLGGLFAFLFPVLSFAQESIDPCAGSNSSLAMCATKDLGIGGAFGTVIQFMFVIAVILALGFLVYGGIRWITSGGDKGGVETARNTIIAAIVGLIVIFLAYVIINLVLVFLTGQGIGGIKIPTLGNACIITKNADGSIATCHSPNDNEFICTGSGGEVGHWDSCNASTL